jgi:hypothetical protein
MSPRVSRVRPSSPQPVAIRTEWSSWRPRRFSPGAVPCTRWIGGSVSPRAGLDPVEYPVAIQTALS